MPQICLPVPDLYQMVTRPVITAIIKQIIKATGIPESTFIEYQGEHEGIPQWRSWIQPEAKDQDQSRFGFYHKVQIDTQEEPLEDTILSTAYHYLDNKIVWEDEALGIQLRPYYEHVEFTINFTYRTLDKGAATRWRNDMRKRFKIKFVDESFTAKYNPVVSRTVIKFLYKFWQMREANAPYGETWDDYFRKNAQQAMTILGMQNGANPEIALQETQLDILGNFEFTNPPKDERVQDGSNYSVGFSYKFRFDRINGFMLRYPLVIHNQPIPKSFIPENQLYNPYAVEGVNSSMSMSRYQTILRQGGFGPQPPFAGEIVPYFDDWYPSRVPRALTPGVQLLIRVDEDDPTKIIDLKNIDGFTIDPELQAFMERHHRKLTLYAGCPIHVCYFNGDVGHDHQDTYVTKDLVVRTTKPMSVRDTHHLVLYFFNDFMSISKPIHEDLRRHPTLLYKFLDMLSPQFKRNDSYPPIVGGKLVREPEYYDCLRSVKTSFVGFQKRPLRPWLTVLEAGMIMKKGAAK